MIVCLALIAHAATAEESSETDDAEQPPPAISGTLGAGALVTSGNTERESLNINVDAEIAYELWRHKARFAGYQASEEGDTTAERYSNSVQSDYRFSERSYLFANVGYDSDQFGSYDRRVSVSVGLGRRFVDTDDVTLELEGGLGRRISEPDGGNRRERESIGRFHGELEWRLTETTRFTQELEIESGDSNTASESVSAIRSRLIGDLSWRLSHRMVHNSEVPADTEKTDTFTALVLEYAF